MPSKQTRQTVLRKGRKTAILELKDEYVFEMDIGSGSIGHPAESPEKERTLFDSLLRAWRRKGYKVIEDTGLVVKAGPKKPSGMDARTWRWVQHADEILEMWKTDDYDNHKDAILDARSMLEKPPKAQSARVQKLENMLGRATKELARLAARDPKIAAYAKGLLSHPTAKRSSKRAG